MFFVRYFPIKNGRSYQYFFFTFRFADYIKPISTSEIKDIQVILPIDKLLGIIAKQLTGKGGVLGIIEMVGDTFTKEKPIYFAIL